MKKIVLASVYIFFVLIICLQVVLILQNEKMSRYHKISEDSLFNADLKNEDTAAIGKKLSDFEEKVTDNSRMIQELEIQNSGFEKNLDALNETYKSILDELRKQTVDVTAKDSALEQMKSDAKKYYAEKNYSACAKLCKDILFYESDDLKIRLLKFKSFYYANPSDGSRYGELLNDFSILKKGGACDDESLHIVEIIKSEKGINDE